MSSLHLLCVMAVVLMHYFKIKKMFPILLLCVFYSRKYFEYFKSFVNCFIGMLRLSLCVNMLHDTSSCLKPTFLGCSLLTMYLLDSTCRGFFFFVFFFVTASLCSLGGFITQLKLVTIHYLFLCLYF